MFIFHPAPLKNHIGHQSAAGHAVQRQGEEADEANEVRRLPEQEGGYVESQAGRTASVDQQEDHRHPAHRGRRGRRVCLQSAGGGEVSVPQENADQYDGLLERPKCPPVYG